MNSIRAIKELNKRELEHAVSTSASWHNDYRDTAFIYVGGLPFQLSEGDVITIFSQYGEPNYINLVRDKETGKSKGFCFLKYEDQRSCDLAVDNLGGATVMGKLLSVDHTRYKPKDDEEIFDNTRGVPDTDAAAADTDNDESDGEEQRPMLKEERELQKIKLDHDDDDPMKAYLIEQKQEEVKLAVQRYEHERRKSSTHKSSEHRRRHRHHRSGDEERQHRHGRHRRHRSRSKSPRDNGDQARRERRSRRPSASPADEERRRHHREHRQHRDHSPSPARHSKGRSEDR